MLRKSICFIFIFSLYTLNILSAQEQEYQSIILNDESKENVKPNKKNNPGEEQYDQEYKNSEKKWNWNYFRVGGNLGLSFGQTTYVEASPAFGYWIIPDRFQFGLSSKFIYQSVRFDNQRWKSFLYGGGFFSDVIIWNGIFARGEFELINKESYFNSNRVNVPHLLIGGGYLQEAGNYGHFYIAALFNVLDSDESIYANSFGGLPLILRMGFGFGFPGGKRRK